DRLGAADRRRLRVTPSAALGSCRYRLSDAEIERALAILRRLDVRYFHYIGGNDSADTAHRLAGAAAAAGYDLRVVSIPKTIDNDLPETDHAPGYGSVGRFLAAATRDSGYDTEATATTYPVKIIEVMGRNAGWLAAASALGKRDERDAPHLVYPPEYALDPEVFLQQVAVVHGRLGYVVAVVAETVRRPDGRPLAGDDPH